eukprot:Nitzschia sp. Nitz4//scaffold24_size164493//53934//54443//NITZ4_002319-RA/size164493-processed-gene-0.189-mRNA-1//1//CDS//3329544087//428//frame0
MKLLLQKLILACVALLAVGQRKTYCEETYCAEPFSFISCEEMLQQYEFHGTSSCCRLVDMPATGGCRVQVGGGGTCWWTPYCGDCYADDAIMCNWEYATDETTPCDDDESYHNPFEIQANETWRANVTCPPTAAPTASPTENPDGGGSGASALPLTVVALLAAAGFALF